MQNYYLLHQEELLILAALFDIHSVYGPICEKNEAEVPYRIHQMVRNGVLQTREEDIYVSEPYKRILQNMKASTRIIKTVSEDKHQTWFYLGNNAVKIEECQTDRNKLKVSIMTLEDVMHLLSEKFFPEEYLNNEISGIETREDAYGNLEDAQMYAFFQMFDVEMQQEKTAIKIIRTRHNLWVVKYDDLGLMDYMEPYENEVLSEMLRELIYTEEET